MTDSEVQVEVILWFRFRHPTDETMPCDRSEETHIKPGGAVYNGGRIPRARGKIEMRAEPKISISRSR